MQQKPDPQIQLIRLLGLANVMIGGYSNDGWLAFLGFVMILFCAVHDARRRLLGNKKYSREM